jgi:hypothetical protein
MSQVVFPKPGGPCKKRGLKQNLCFWQLPQKLPDYPKFFFVLQNLGNSADEFFLPASVRHQKNYLYRREKIGHFF